MPKSNFSSSRLPAKPQQNQQLTTKTGVGDHQQQGELFPVTEIEVDGVQMGVLSDGSPYLTLRGLARMCGINHTSLLTLANNWTEEREKPRGIKIQELLVAQGHNIDRLYIKVRGQSGETHAYTDAACMAILEYYAFESTQGAGETALRNYRLLARDSFRSFIYKRCHYDPSKLLSDSWRNFHERVLLNDQLPAGYFSIFKEVADLVLRMIQQGCELDDHTIPDASVGKCWSNYWDQQGYDSRYGDRSKHPHYYPEWFPQSAANPLPAWVYPDDALGAFRRWMHDVYLPEKFPNYIETKVKKGTFLPSRAKSLIEAVKPKQLQR